MQVPKSEGWGKILQKMWLHFKKIFTTSLKSKNNIPTMLTEAECSYLYCYAAKEYVGQGEIVELGCWLGGGTAALAQGLNAMV